MYCCTPKAISWSHRQHSSSSKHGELSWCQRARFWSHLITTLSPSSPLNHWQTSDGPLHVLSWAGGPCGRCRISVLQGIVCYQSFSWWILSQLPWDHWQDPPVQFWADSSSFSWSLKLHKVRSCMEPQSEGDDNYFVFLPFVNNRTNCCHLLTKLLGDGLVAHSSLI